MKIMENKIQSRDEKAREEIKKKTILIYGSSALGTTGNGKLIFNMAKAFQSEGHKVYTVGFDYNGVQISQNGIIVLPGFHCEVCGNSNKGESWRVQKIADYITYFQPDYFICVGDQIMFQQFGLGKLNLPDMKTKAILYSTVDSEGLPFCNANLINAGLPDYAEICDRIIGSADFSVNQYKYWLDLDVTSIPEPVDGDVYKPVTAERKLELRKKYRFPEEGFIMYYSGRNIMRKRPFTLLEAAAEFLTKTTNTYLYVNTPPSIKGEVAFYPDELNPIDYVKRVLKRKYGRDLMEEGRIVFLGRGGLGDPKISEAQNAELYQLSDLYVMTTGAEGFNLTPVEASLCGVPIIVPDNSTGPEIVGVTDDNDKELMEMDFRFGNLGECGILTSAPIESFETYGLKQNLTTHTITSQAMSWMYEHPTERLELGKSAREYALKKFNFEDFKKRWLKVIRETEKKKKISAEEFKKPVILNEPMEEK